MSFSGITFPNQKVIPSNDAMVRKALLSDGILQGCALTYAGFTLTMAAGDFLLSGRSIQHPAAESWSVAGASSGYARLVITIDLSKTATVDTFEQIDAAIEYASTADGFPVLEQSEINVSGTKYQAEFCVVSLSSGGITGIVRHLSTASLRAMPDFLSNLFAAGYTRLSGYQIVDSVEAIPADAPVGAVFFIPEED